MGRKQTPQRPLAVKNAVKSTPAPKHASVQKATKVKAGKRSASMESALRGVERGSPGRPPRPSPAVKREGGK